MADKKISALTALIQANVDTTNDVLPIVDTNATETKKVTPAALVGAAAAAGLTNVDINSGTIDGVTIATSDITVGATKTLDVSAGTLTLANDQISGDKIEGGTINAVTINTLTSTAVNATTLDATNLEVTNLKAKDGTAAGSIADSTGVVTIGSSVLTTTDINGGTIDGTPIGANSASTGAFTTLSSTGNTTIGSDASDTVTVNADVASSLIPSADDTHDLGAVGSEWRDLYVDGTANIDSLIADTADINGGTIDGTTIATSDITVGSGKTLNVSGGTLTLANDQISGDSVEGGTINAITINTLGGTTANVTTVNATTVDATNVEVTNVKAKDGTAAITIDDSTGNVGLSGNLTFSGTGQRITGDTSNATFGNRLAVQNSVTNGITQIPLLPNGTATTAGILPFNNSDTTNAAFFLVAARSTDATLLSGITGTGTYLPMTFYTGGSERLRIDTSGNVGIGTASVAVAKVIMGGTLPSSGAASQGFRSIGQIPSATTSNYIGFFSFPTTEAASFTLTGLRHFSAGAQAFGAGSAVTSQYGFEAVSSLTGATNNYGFYSNIASGSNRWNLYCAGSADNYMAGDLLIGTTTPNPSGFGITLRGSTPRFTLEPTADTQSCRIQFALTDGTIQTAIRAGGVEGRDFKFVDEVGAVTRLFIEGSTGNIKIGGTTAARSTTAGTNQLVLFNGTAPVGTLTNGVSFYSASGEANVMDAAGNATLLSPHDSETNEWIFRSKHTPTGKVLKIDVEKMLRFINEHFDLDMVQEWTE